MAVRRVMHTAIATADLDRSVRFWTELGFVEVRRWEWPAGVATINGFLGVDDSAARAALLEGNGTGIEIFEFSLPRQEPTRDPAVFRLGYTHVCLEVDDLDRELARLTAVGLRTWARPVDAPDGRRMVYGRDPDGNVVELVQLPS